MRHKEDPTAKGGVNGSTEVIEELYPQGYEQGPGSIGAPGYCWSGVGIGRPPSREGGSPGTGPAVRGSDSPTPWFCSPADHAAKAEVRTASQRQVSFLILVLVFP